MNEQEAAPGRPRNQHLQVGSDDLVADIAVMAADPNSDDQEIMEKLNRLASTLTREKMFAALVRFDTPDVLG